MRHYAALFVFVTCSIFSAAGNLKIKPTTTLAAQSSNNTSAAGNFLVQSNGNLGASNISKVDVHSLLYPGAHTSVLAHLLLWFGRPDHINVGYSSTDPAEVHAQIEDMISRGIQGVVLDWYGPNNSMDQAAQLVMKEAETHPGFSFAIMVDKGALLTPCYGCSPQQTLIEQLQYVEQTYFPSSAYLRINGQPVVTNFDLDLHYSIDWNAVKSALSSNPDFLFQNDDGFSHAVSGGAYSWVQPTTTDFGMSYLTSFYQTGMSHPSEDSVGAAYKGFNDSLASWGEHRFMSQQCGQTWLETFAKINSLYDSNNQLATLQLVTWNDYEEGSEIESGIDNCASIAGSVSGSSLQWQLKGDDSTVDHYSLYVSTDGQNLMPLDEQSVGNNSLDMCSYALAPGKYTLYMQAVGKPSLANHISGPLAYDAQCASASAPPSPSITLTASPKAVTIHGSGSADLGLNVALGTGAANTVVSFSCSNLPAGVTCAFAPASVTASGKPAQANLTISRTTTSALGGPSHHDPNPFPFLNGLAGFAVAGFGIAGALEKRRLLRMLAVTGLLAGALVLSSCGSGAGQQQSNSTAAPALGTYTVSVNAVAGSSQATTTISVTLQ